MRILQCFRRIKNDVLFRRKFIITMSVFFSYVLQGWSEQQIGLTLSDLQEQIDVDQETVSFIFMTWNAGCVTGSLVSGVMFDNYNRLIMMFATTLGLAVFTTALPFCTTLTLMLVCRFFLGVFNGVSDTGSNTIIPTIWGNECGPFVQMLYVCYAIGGILSPYATLAFISRHHDSSLSSPFSLVNTRLNDTLTPIQNDSTANVRVSFIITSALFVTCSIPYIIMKFIAHYDVLAGRIDNENQLSTCPENRTTNVPGKTVGKDSETKGTNCDGDQIAVNSCTKVGRSGMCNLGLILCLMGGIHALYITTEESLVAYLVIFLLKHLEWNEVNAITLVSFFWVASCISGVLGIVVVTFIDPTNILWMSLILTNCSFVFVIVASYSSQTWLIWFGFISSGCFIMMVIPTVFTWSQKYACEISGKVSSFFIVSSGLCSGATTYFVSYMMDNYSKLAFVYIILGEMLVGLLLYGCANVLFFQSVYRSETLCCRNKQYAVYSKREISQSPNSVIGVSIVSSGKGQIC